MAGEIHKAICEDSEKQKPHEIQQHNASGVVYSQGVMLYRTCVCLLKNQTEPPFAHSLAGFQPPGVGQGKNHTAVPRSVPPPTPKWPESSRRVWSWSEASTTTCGIILFQVRHACGGCGISSKLSRKEISLFFKSDSVYARALARNSVICVLSSQGSHTNLEGLFGAQKISESPCVTHGSDYHCPRSVWRVSLLGLGPASFPSSLLSPELSPAWHGSGLALILKKFGIYRPPCFSWALGMSFPSISRSSLFPRQTHWPIPCPHINTLTSMIFSISSGFWNIRDVSRLPGRKITLTW